MEGLQRLIDTGASKLPTPARDSNEMDAEVSLTREG